MHIRFAALIGLGLLFCLSSQAQTALPSPSIGTQLKVHGLLWDAHEVTVAQVKRFAQSTGFVSRAEKEGGGFIYESGFVLKKGWNWRAPFGIPAQDNDFGAHCRHWDIGSVSLKQNRQGLAIFVRQKRH